MESKFAHLLPIPKHVVQADGSLPLSNIRYLSLPDEFRDYVEPCHEWLPKDVSLVYDGRPDTESVGIHCQIDALGEEEFIINLGTTEILIRTGGHRGLLYALYTLSDLASLSNGLLPCGQIHDYPDISLRVFHLDCRGQHPVLAHMKEWIRQLSRFRYNGIILEYESYYPYRKHRILNAPDGYTEEEIRDIVSYAADRGIEIIPCLQTFAHVEHILKLTVFRHLAENRGLFTDSVVQVCPCHPGAISLFRDLIGELAAAHPSPYIHIGADETIKLGYCETCEAIVKQSGKGYLYAQYINQMAQLVREAGKTPIIWADIAMQYPESLDLISKDTILIHWDYFHVTPQEFAGAKQLQEMEYRFWIAPAALSAPDSSPLSLTEVGFQHHERNIRAAVEAVHLYKGGGIVTTAWTVDGDFAYLRSGWEVISPEAVHRNAIYDIKHNARRFLREALMPYIAAGSLYAWNGKEMNERYMSRFEAVFFNQTEGEGRMQCLYDHFERNEYDRVLEIITECQVTKNQPYMTALELMAECGKLDQEFHSLCTTYDDSDSFYQQAVAFKSTMQQMKQRFYALCTEWFGSREAQKETEYRFLKYEKEFESI